MNRLPQKFFERDTLVVARELLGYEFVFGDLAGVIVETEAYVGRDDPACHAARGRTKRNEVMWGSAGHAYVYFTYGMHFCLNLVTEKTDFPAAVLVRAVVPTRGLAEIRANRERQNSFKKTARRNPIAEKNLTNGPSKFCAAFGITLAENGVDVCTPNSKIFVTPAAKKIDFETTPRIGIREGCEKLWRFVAKI